MNNYVPSRAQSKLGGKSRWTSKNVLAYAEGTKLKERQHGERGQKK
jgi:hypothetical protein